MNLMHASLVRRVGALVILLLVVLLGGGAIIIPAWQTITETNDEIAHLDTQLSRLRAIAERKPIAERQLAELRRGIAADAVFWSGASSAAISANIQNTIRQSVGSGGGQVRSASDAGESTERELRKISIRISAEGPLESLQRVLAMIATSKPLLFVDALTLTATGAETLRDRPPQIAYELAVTGYTGITRP